MVPTKKPCSKNHAIINPRGSHFVSASYILIRNKKRTVNANLHQDRKDTSYVTHQTRTGFSTTKYAEILIITQNHSRTVISLIQHIDLFVHMSQNNAGNTQEIPQLNEKILCNIFARVSISIHRPAFGERSCTALQAGHLDMMY